MLLSMLQAVGCSSRVILVPDGQPVMLAEPVKAKVYAFDATGKLVETATVFPHEPRRDWDGSLFALAKLCEKHGVNLIAIGNGTASRETDKLAGELIGQLAQRQPERVIEKVVVSEAGASV